MIRAEELARRQRTLVRTTLLARMRRKSSRLRRLRMAAGERRGSADAPLTSEMQEEHDLDADLVATPALFVSTEKTSNSLE
ncbi:hypothetical protein NDU88_005201 [Pleurodeles waltl]|uniref:Uncharacterized protein n=1 Tax=Pleurodeles waltl TaxID=8319 RepID=A0AAV7MC80_PLEWA|nr:hypothetical protein NDU88_005201 [Pleurodeles waltl]